MSTATLEEDKSSSAQLEINQAFNRYAPELTAYIKRKTSGASDLHQDLLQDTFLSFYRHVAKGGDRTEERALLYAIVKSKIIDHHRRTQIRPEHTVEHDQIVEEPSLHQERYVIGEEKLDLLETVILNLPEKCRTVFVLKTYEGRRHNDIAAICNISTSMVEKHLAKAYAIIHKKIKDI